MEKLSRHVWELMSSLKFVGASDRQERRASTIVRAAELVIIGNYA